MRRSWLLTLLVLVGLVAPTTAYAYVPREGATHNVPAPWGGHEARWRIVEHVGQAIRRTPGPTERHPEPTILIASYLMDHEASVDALVAACRRGVSVRVILDAGIDNAKARRLVTMLNGDNVPDEDGDGVPDREPRRGPCNRDLNPRVGADAEPPRIFTRTEALASMREPTDNPVTWGTDRSYAKICSASCRGRRGQMHTKFYAFSRTGRARDVVMVSSSNLNKGGALKGWNDLYTINEKPDTYQMYLRMHLAMTRDRPDKRRVEFTDGAFVHRFFPQAHGGRSNDPTMHDLNRIGCHSAFGRTRINISMFYWAGTRGHYLLDKVLGLARGGCRVSIIVGAPSREIMERLREAARNHRITLFDSRWDWNENGEPEVRTHAKYVLVRGRFGGDASSHQVMTGSQNWGPGSLSKSDDSTLKIAKRSAYVDYMRNWEAIRNHSRRVPMPG